MTIKSKDIHLSNVSDSVEVDVKRGDVEVTSYKGPLPKLNLRTAAGNIDVALPPGAKFELQADARRGDIENDFGSGLKQTSSGRGANLSGSVGQGPLVRVETLRGNITLRKASETEELSKNSLPAPPEPPAPPKEPKAPHKPKVSDLHVQSQ